MGRRAVSTNQILATIGALIALLAALGWLSPARRIEEESQRITTVQAQVTGLGGRVTDVESDMRDLRSSQHFSNYLLCVMLRRTDPAAVPDDCAPVLSARVGR